MKTFKKQRGDAVWTVLLIIVLLVMLMAHCNRVEYEKAYDTFKEKCTQKTGQVLTIGHREKSWLCADENGKILMTSD